MSSPRDRILAELDIQARHEGETDNIAACRLILRHARTSGDFQALVSIQHHRHGALSYETHRFYYLRDWVTPLLKELAPRLAA